MAQPLVLQVSDVVPLQIGDDLVYLRVVWIEYARDTSYVERVLDVADDAKLASKVLPSRSVKVTELSFNERQGYMCHASAL